MNDKIETIHECEETINSILLEFAELIEKIEPEHSTILYSILPTVRNSLILSLCPKVLRKPVKYENLRNRVWLTATEEFLSYLISYKQPIIKYIKPFIDEIIATGLDITITLTYADTEPEVVIELIRCRAELEEIPQDTVNYIVKYASRYARTKREFSAFVMFTYFYMAENLTLPDDLIENIGYYLQKLPTIYQHEVLARLHITSYLRTINQSLLTVVKRATAYAYLSDKQQVLNVLQNLSLTDKKHLQFIKTLHEHGILSREDLQENLEYIRQVKQVTKKIPKLNELIKSVEEELKEEMEKILSNYPSQLKKRITERQSEYLLKLSLLYSLLYDTIVFTKTALEFLQLYYAKFIKYTGVTKVTDKGLTYLYPYKNLFPYVLVYEVIHQLFVMLPEIQPLQK